MKDNASALAMSSAMHSAFIARSETSDAAPSSSASSTAWSTVSINRSGQVPMGHAKRYSGQPNNARWVATAPATKVGWRQRMVAWLRSELFVVSHHHPARHVAQDEGRLPVMRVDPPRDADGGTDEHVALPMAVDLHARDGVVRGKHRKPVDPG